DQAVDLTRARFLIEIHAIGSQRILLLLLAALLAFPGRIRRLILVGSPRAPARRCTRTLGNAVADVVHGIITRHLLFLQEVGSMALALGKDCHENIRA